MSFIFKKFSLMALGWFFICAAILLWKSDSFPSEFLGFTQIFVWAQANLVFLLLLMRNLFLLVGANDPNQAQILRLKVVLWGTLKVSCLLLGVVFLWAGSKITGFALVLGITSLLVVPLGGGLLWRQEGSH